MRKFWKREPTVNESTDKPSSGNVLKMVTLRNGQFFCFDGKLYENDIVRACIRPKVKAIGKLVGKQIRDDPKAGGLKVNPDYGLGRVQLEIFEQTVEHQLRDPTFITAYPTEVSPLARRNDDDPSITDRFELFIGGREIANGFSELNDPEDQAERFRKQVEAKAAGDDEAMHYDADYVRALEYGLPPTAGEGIGIDRLVMLFTNAASIRDVLLFPHLRPES